MYLCFLWILRLCFCLPFHTGKAQVSKLALGAGLHRYHAVWGEMRGQARTRQAAGYEAAPTSLEPATGSLNLSPGSEDLPQHEGSMRTFWEGTLRDVLSCERRQPQPSAMQHKAEHSVQHLSSPCLPGNAPASPMQLLLFSINQKGIKSSLSEWLFLTLSPVSLKCE